MAKEEGNMYKTQCLKSGALLTSVGKRKGLGIDAPSAPFLSSLALQDTDQHLSSIPSITLPASIASRSPDGLAGGDECSVSYGSLRGSSFHLRRKHSRYEKSRTSHSEVPHETLTTGSMPRFPAGETFEAQFRTPKQKGYTSHSTAVKNQSSSSSPIREEECKKPDFILKDSALENVCDNFSTFSLDKNQNENDRSEELDIDLRFGTSLTALGVMEFTRAHQKEHQYSCDKKLARSLREDLMLIALQQWTSRSYDEAEASGRRLNFHGSNDKELGSKDICSSLKDFHPAVDIKSSGFTHDNNNCCRENFFLRDIKNDDICDESCGEVDDDDPDTFEQFEFELE